MHKQFFYLLLLLCSAPLFSQTYNLKGKITDTEDFALESATVYLTAVKDSAVIDYTITDKNGNWELKTRKNDDAVFLKISYVGLANYKQKLEAINADRDFGTIKLQDRSTELNEVIIEGEVPPIRIKSDTLEFNASSFKVRPDANVESLLKQLPGVDIDADGKITVNGKEVNQILVNGKPFFDKDGKIAIQNLPAELINKVQVTDTKTKKEELAGDKASGNNASINLTIDEDKNKGFFGRVMGGYGSDERYESSAMVNYFNGKRKISLLASSNNINSTGFSMNEIFDSMGGGRNMSVWTNGNGSFGINGMRFGGGDGITQSNIVGLNYSDEWVENLESNFSYFYTSSDTENENRTRRRTFLPAQAGDAPELERSLLTESTSTTNDEKYAHNISSEFEFEVDSTSNIYFTPKFTKANSKVSRRETQFTWNQDDTLLNESSGYGYNENDNSSFSSDFNYYKSFKKKGRAISLDFENENRLDESQNLNNSTTLFYEDIDDDGVVDVTEDTRNQTIYNRQTSDRYEARLEYTEPISDSLRVKAGVIYTWQKEMENRQGFDFNEVTGRYSSPVDELTNYLTSNTNTVIPMAGFNIRKSKMNINLMAGTLISKFDNFSSYLGEDYKLVKNYTLPYANGYMSYSFTKTRSFWGSYNYETNFPQARQILPVLDVSNQLYTYIGNPDLSPNKSHSVYLSFRDFDFATRTGYNFYAGGNIYDSRITQVSEINNSGKWTTTYRNVSGTYSGWAGFSWNKSIKREAHSFRLNLGMSTGFDFEKGFTNGQMYEGRSYRLSPRASLTYDYGELLSINPSYNLTYNQTNYDNFTVDSQSNVVHRVNLQTTSYWPKHVVFGNDFGYTYNSNLSNGFRKDFFLWNTSLGYNFYNDRLLFKVKVYDVLNQNIGTSRTISASSITDEQNIVLKRYVMFSLTFKLDKFGGKKKEGGSTFFIF
ncbi:outer membrane beta-barrel protein [Flavobacterium sp. MK4S-17]|uniref:outer membrane beta-barrel protein n=1 Tax=Flavobacterium sp. MK4S-17 TaxID=2543737 RepID=UPI00135B0CEC|nr:outer membrane beta-barrel protein [Flavobacterium sp. MK4S-17]